MSRAQDRKMVVQMIELYNYYRERLINLALAEFDWHGLPDTCDRDYFERCLLFKGKAAIYIPQDTNFFLSTSWMTIGNFNAYGYPVEIVGIDFNGKNIKTEEWEIIFDNKTRTNLLPKIDIYAKLLAETHQTIRANMFHQRHPYIAPCDRTEQLSYRNFYDRMDAFEPFIPVKKSFDFEGIKPFDLSSPYIGNDLYDTLKKLWAEALAMLGITAETTKKERLIQDEITIDRQEDIISLNSRLLNRVELCNKINKRWGLDVSVNLSSQDFELKDPRDSTDEIIQDREE